MSLLPRATLHSDSEQYLQSVAPPPGYPALRRSSQTGWWAACILHETCDCMLLFERDSLPEIGLYFLGSVKLN
jgi:hypothetical protein